MIMLPQQHIKDVYHRPEDEISGLLAMNDTIQAYYTLGDPEIYVNQFHFNTVRNQLTRKIAQFSEQMAEELEEGLKYHWQEPRDWTTVQIWEFCLKVISRASNRVFVGPALCVFSAWLSTMIYSVQLIIIPKVATKSFSKTCASTPCPSLLEHL